MPLHALQFFQAVRLIRIDIWIDSFSFFQIAVSFITIAITMVMRLAYLWINVMWKSDIKANVENNAFGLTQEYHQLTVIAHLLVQRSKQKSIFLQILIREERLFFLKINLSIADRLSDFPKSHQPIHSIIFYDSFKSTYHRVHSSFSRLIFYFSLSLDISSNPTTIKCLSGDWIYGSC